MHKLGPTIPITHDRQGRGPHCAPLAPHAHPALERSVCWVGYWWPLTSSHRGARERHSRVSRLLGCNPSCSLSVTLVAPWLHRPLDPLAIARRYARKMWMFRGAFSAGRGIDRMARSPSKRGRLHGKGVPVLGLAEAGRWQLQVIIAPARARALSQGGEAATTDVGEIVGALSPAAHCSASAPHSMGWALFGECSRALLMTARIQLPRRVGWGHPRGRWGVARERPEVRSEGCSEIRLEAGPYGLSRSGGSGLVGRPKEGYASVASTLVA